MWQSLIAPITGLLDKIVPDADERARLAHEINTLAERQHHETVMAQIAVNQQEAAHKSIFVSGWRPFIGWVCGIALAYSTIASPFLAIWFAVPAVNVELLWPVLGGMLGLGGMRTVEKTKGVARAK